MTEQVLALSNSTSASVERNLERMSSAAGQVDGLDEMIAEGQQAFQERMLGHIDERMAQIARLVRSDSQALASKMDEMTQQEPAEQLDAELLRSVLRSVKELQAGMATDMLGSIDVRFQQAADQLHREGQEQAEAMLKVAEVLGAKIDRLSVRVDEGVGNDLQIVVDRMSDAIRAMSGVRREIA
jgi:ABC-type polar amino acid transport system ATPase subunit